MTRAKSPARSALESALALQRAAYLADPVPSLARRRDDLRTLQRFIRDHKQALCDAVSADYGHRSRHETLLAEIFPAIDGIDHALKHLRGWMKPQRRAVDWRNFFGATQPRDPAAGRRGRRDRAVELPGQPEPGAADLHLCRRQPGDGQDERELAPPGAAVHRQAAGLLSAREAADLRRDRRGRHRLLQAAVRPPAVHRLGPDRTRGDGGRGAEPVPGDAGARWQGAGRRLRRLSAAHRRPSASCSSSTSMPARSARRWTMRGCRRSSIDAFVRHAREIVPARYPRLDSPDYTSIIDERSFDRLLHALDDARERGAQVLPLLPGPAFDRATRKIAPHIVLDAPDDSLLMQREIFGPILPLRSYTSLDEVIDRINAGPRPLALYPFSHDRRRGAAPARPGDLGRRDGQRRAVPRRPARPAVRWHRRLGHGPLPRPRRLRDLLEAASGASTRRASAP